ncbi:MAG: WD40/YVTN/BNR-like repeat-containing protein [Bacteroidales bacterium]
MNRILLTILACFSILSLYSQWTWQNPYPQSNHLYGLSFTDTLNGWACGHYGSLNHTINGGIDWQVVNSGTTSRILSIYFIDEMKGWAGALNDEILSTSDGGKTWSIMHVGIQNRYRDIFFSDSLNGWTLGRFGYILNYSRKVEI